jgi:aminoglycoside phosphotransferase family enzyme
MRDDGIELAHKVAALCRPETYPEAPARIEVIETHMSFVFLTPRQAYKVKKPVRYEFLDFSTLELRRRDCEEELRLNQRLARGVYQAVVALVQGPNGRLHLGAHGTIVEWLVQMKRLPQERMLDERIRRGTITESELLALAARLAEFYRDCTPEPLTTQDYQSRLAKEIDTDRMALESETGELSQREVAETAAALSTFIERRRALFDQRIAQGRIVEGHGDLRPEHVCLLDEPVVFDCLEFNRRLRVVDPADELAYLALECERLGAGPVGSTLIDGYCQRSGDTPPPPLIDFYKARRASLRARLSILHTHDVDAPLRARWLTKARGYLAMAATYAERMNVG